MHRYHELRIPGRFEPLVLAGALAASGSFASHVVYERDGDWWFAGDTLAEVVLDRDSLRTTVEGRTSVEPWSGASLAPVSLALSGAGVARWRAFGWAAFELSYVLAGKRDLVGAQTLLHLCVPRTEIRIAVDEVVVRTVDVDRLTDVRDLIAVPFDLSAAVDATPVDVTAEDGRAAYQGAVSAAVADIRAGQLQKVILSRAVEVPFNVDLVSTYVLGRRSNTPARSFLLDLGGWRAAGFSPETVAEVGADGRVSTQPLAGTRARTGAASDAARRADLVTDPKEVYEHAASVKLACDELAALCEPGSVAVAEFMAVKERGSVQHLGSRVTGALAPGADAFTALAALFPAITASGIPKAPAYDRIAALEDGPRDLYAGAVLMADHEGGLDAALVLRAIYQHGGRTWLRAGAGIVADSTPEREYTETCEKLASVAPHVVRAVRELAEV
ncbi:salicylate synthase [Actinokineospora sp. G85]|uniref:salicylate synthase n=1 Tax=Actinokineospora sp. G85 TaxID=3406626 RepID=UPI003C75811A